MPKLTDIVAEGIQAMLTIWSMGDQQDVDEADALIAALIGAIEYPDVDWPTALARLNDLKDLAR